MTRGLHRRGKVWSISYQRNGRQVRESTGCSSKRAAAKYRDRRISELLTGAWQPATSAPRLSEFGETFLSWVANPTTRDRYRTSVKNLVAYLGDPKLSNVSTAQLYQYQVDGLKAHKSPVTRNRDIAVLRRLYSLGKKRGLLDVKNPCSEVEPLNETMTRRSGQPFTREEEARITGAASGWFQLLFIVLVETGLRVKREALPLKWSDVDLDLEPGRLIVRSSKTAAGVRTAFLTSYCKDALLKWRAVAGPFFLAVCICKPERPVEAHRRLQVAMEDNRKESGYR